jgi:hypothetical protein
LDIVKEEESPSIARKALIHIDIEISESEKDRITVYEGDDPSVLASNFCSRHNLNLQT